MTTVAVQIVNALLSAVDGSNWPEYTGERFQGYNDAMETIHNIITDYQQAAYDEQKELQSGTPTNT